MTRILAALVLGALPLAAPAGIETGLVRHTAGACTLRIVHDATPDATTGTLVVRSYRDVNGIHQPCPSGEAEVEAAVREAFARSRARQLKPVTSIFIGRLIHYPWIETHYRNAARRYDPAAGRLPAKAFLAGLLDPALIGPFQAAIRPYGYRVSRAVCEKLIYFPNGAPQDALCWLTLATPGDSSALNH